MPLGVANFLQRIININEHKMKKLFLITTIFVVFFSTKLIAQDMTTSGTPASNYPILEKKLESSNKNLENPKKTEKAKFWIQRAELMMDIYEVNLQYLYKGTSETNIMLIFGKPNEEKTEVKDGVEYKTQIFDRVNITFVNGVIDSYKETKKIHEDPLPVAKEALAKAEEVDVEKKESEKILETYERLKGLYDRDGIEQFTAGNYEKSFKDFATIAKINENPLFEGKVDTVVFYNAGMAASKADMIEESIKFYELARKYNHPEPALYVFLKQKYFITGDTVKGVEVLSDGFDKYPEDQSILVELINYYLANDKGDEALNYLKIAQEDDPTNLSFKFAEGNLYDKMGEVDKAREVYQKCLDQNSEYFNALYNMGISYYNESLKMLEEAENIPPKQVKEYEAAVVTAEDELSKGLPYMEKAHEVMPNEMDVVDVLKSFYYRLEMTDKFNEMKAILEGGN